MFPSSTDRTRPIAPKVVFLACRRASQMAGISKPVHPHLLRHAFATHLLESGTNLRTIQILPGHANLETTVRYLRVADVAVRSTPSPVDALDVHFPSVEPLTHVGPRLANDTREGNQNVPGRNATNAKQLHAGPRVCVQSRDDLIWTRCADDEQDIGCSLQRDSASRLVVPGEGKPEKLRRAFG